MTPVPAAAGAAVVRLLDRAVEYAVTAVAAIPVEGTGWPTPCRDWSVADLLDHLDDSLGALAEALGSEVIDADSGFAERVSRLPALAAAQSAGRSPVVIRGCPVRSELVVATAALEVAVHAWDVRRACGCRRPMPAELATPLLAVATLVVPPTDRAPHFAVPTAPAPRGDPGDLLVGYLGRAAD